jgi:hypothetical protein
MTIKDMELMDFNVEWSLGQPARVSFIIKIKDKYIMQAHDLIGDVTITDEKK